MYPTYLTVKAKAFEEANDVCQETMPEKCKLVCDCSKIKGVFK